MAAEMQVGCPMLAFCVMLHELVSVMWPVSRDQFDASLNMRLCPIMPTLPTELSENLD